VLRIRMFDTNCCTQNAEEITASLYVNL